MAITPRQLDVLRLVAAGLANREIARRLGITEAGVKFHVSGLFRHYGVDNRVAMVVSSLRSVRPATDRDVPARLPHSAVRRRDDGDHATRPDG